MSRFIRSKKNLLFFFVVLSLLIFGYEIIHRDSAQVFFDDLEGEGSSISSRKFEDSHGIINGEELSQSRLENGFSQLSIADYEARMLILQSMNKDELLLALQTIKDDDTPAHQKNALLRRLFTQLSSIMEFDQVVGIIDASLGPGSFREAALIGLILGAQLPMIEIGNLVDASEPGHREYMIEGIKRKASDNSENIDVAGFLNEKFSDDRLHLEFLYGVGQRYTAGFESEICLSVKLLEAVNLIKVGGLDNEAAIEFLLTPIAAYSPRAAMEAYLKSGVTILDSEFSVDLIGNLVRTNDEIAQKILWSEASVSSSLAVKIAYISGLTKLDSDLAQDWFEKTQNESHGEKHDLLLEAWLVEKAKRGDYQEGRKLVQDISDPQIRKEVEGRLWEAEKTEIVNNVRADPESTISSIVNGESGHADYWLEASIGTWLKRDSVAVNDWYEDNWRSLSSEKTQYVAAAFAQEAVTLGDLPTAKAWAERIQNPKTRERIQSVIEDAQNK